MWKGYMQVKAWYRAVASQKKKIMQRDGSVNFPNVVYSKYTSGIGQYQAEVVILVQGIGDSLTPS